MKMIDRYLLKQTSLMVAIVFFTIAGLLLVTGIADEAARKVNETYTLQHAFIFKISMLANDTYDYVAVIVMLGTLITVASFNKHQELTTIQLSAQSAIGLVFRLMLPALIMLPLLFALGEVIGPNLVQAAEQRRAELLGEKSPTLKGQWFKSGNEFINIEFIGLEELNGISRFVLREDHSLSSAHFSQKAVFENDHWELFATTSIAHQQNQYLHSTQENMNWQNALFTPDLIRKLILKPEFLTIKELGEQVNFRKEAGTLTPAIERAYWSRVFFPVQYVSLVLIALAFSFGSFRQKTVGDAAFKAIVVGVVAGLILDTVSVGFMIVNFPASVAVLSSNLCLFLISILAIKRSY